jgi:hypothetical protein
MYSRKLYENIFIDIRDVLNVTDESL